MGSIQAWYSSVHLDVLGREIKRRHYECKVIFIWEDFREFLECVKGYLFLFGPWVFTYFFPFKICFKWWFSSWRTSCITYKLYLMMNNQICFWDLLLCLHYLNSAYQCCRLCCGKFKLAVSGLWGNCSWKSRCAPLMLIKVTDNVSLKKAVSEQKF